MRHCIVSVCPTYPESILMKSKLWSIRENTFFYIYLSAFWHWQSIVKNLTSGLLANATFDIGDASVLLHCPWHWQCRFDKGNEKHLSLNTTIWRQLKMSPAPSVIQVTFLLMIVIDLPLLFLRWVWSLSGSVYCVDTKRPRQHLKGAAPFITEVLHFEGRRAGLKGLGYERLRTPVMFTAHKVATRSSQRHAPGLRSTQHNNTHPHPLTHPSLPLPIVNGIFIYKW